jgi:DNA-binding NarL/FixJ family response regulator
MFEGKVIRIHIVEDHQIFRVGLKYTLNEIPGVQVIGESSNGNEFLAQLLNKIPDIVFMDIKMPGMGGVEAARIALDRYPDLSIIVMTSFGEEDVITEMIRLGISGFMLKNADKDSLEKAIRRVVAGDQYFSDEIMSALAKSINKIAREQNYKPDIELTERETEVLQLLSKGLSNKEIADKLFISSRTVEGYKSKLIEKSGQANSLSLIIWAIKNKLVRIE